ncbi:T3SS effector HopA1 family protein [Actinoplanes sp. NEAU-A12]|uniref:T3SS effector HopA1 family protein n=1 Tax=Actinoplanes sandaracinus TaxID=3045177 RepID=A0ABT6WHE1_9ACTN|nr:T3SS effector HopA1 family protein [Actinoplanes sandaracinus]MDI6099139.1 T3SS effector HopA1 family protein [Actinoplanes sandaracinus]
MLINPRLAAAADAIGIAADGRSAEVAGLALRAEDARELRGTLSLHLYRHLHAGARPPAADATLMPRRRYGTRFEAELHDQVPHSRTTSHGLLLELDGQDLVVRLPEITARISRDRYVGPGEPRVGEIVEVLLDARRPHVSPGFYYVMGSRRPVLPDERVRRLFVHITDARHAPAIWRATLHHLERAEVGYHAKILSDPAAYPRRDALVVYLTGAPARAEQELAEALDGFAGIAPEISAFTEQYRPGISGADDPDDPRPGQTGLSFGQHRSTALATALLHHATTPGAESRDEVIARVFRQARIDPLCPARNLTEDLTHV